MKINENLDANYLIKLRNSFKKNIIVSFYVSNNAVSMISARVVQPDDILIEYDEHLVSSEVNYIG